AFRLCVLAQEFPGVFARRHEGPPPIEGIAYRKRVGNVPNRKGGPAGRQSTTYSCVALQRTQWAEDSPNTCPRVQAKTWRNDRRGPARRLRFRAPRPKTLKDCKRFPQGRLHKISAKQCGAQKYLKKWAGKAGKFSCLHKTGACGKVVNAM